MSFIQDFKKLFSPADENKLDSKIKNAVVIPNPEAEPEVEIITSNGYGSFRTGINFDETSRNVRQLITTYRDMALQAEVDSAVQEITNEAIVIDTDRVVSLNITYEKISKNIIEKIKNEFNNILRLMDFNRIGDEFFRQWYEDGRIYLHGVIDTKKINEGIQDIKILSPLSLKKIKEKGEYFYIYETINSDIIIKIPADHITYCSSGLTTSDKKMYISYLHRAIKPFNQLRMLEDSAVIYRITRAPERRVFYVDVGQMNKSKAEAYMNNLMTRFRNKITYDSNTGKLNQQKNTLTMTEDFWLPSSESGAGSRGTKVDTLPAGCLSMDTKISLLDGRELSIKEIELELKEDKELWIYSCHPTTGAISPGLISWAGVTQKSAKVMKITLDNGESIICTPDHNFPIYEKGFVRADTLEINESLIPLYRKTEFISEHKKLNYEQFFDNDIKEWIFTHTMLIQLVKQFNYKNWADFRKKESIFDHKIIKIEYLEDEIEVGTLTIDEEEKYHNYHTFALSCGVFTKNSNLGELADIEYFKRKLLKSLRVPYSRFDQEQPGTLAFGNMQGEMSRDEVRFSKFINKLRSKFGTIFFDLLKKQLIFKNIISPEDWVEWKDYFILNWKSDSYFTEVKEGEINKNRIELADSLSEYVGKYFSHEYVMKKVFKMTDEEIKEEMNKIDEEVSSKRFEPADDSEY